jgi:hypothetical protein
MSTLCSYAVHAPTASIVVADASLGAFKSIVTALLSMGQTSSAEVLRLLLPNNLAAHRIKSHFVFVAISMIRFCFAGSILRGCFAVHPFFISTRR